MTDTRLLNRSVPTEHTNMVSADQITILGNGTFEDPLRSAGAGTTFVADFFPADTPILLGQAAVVYFVPPVTTDVSVTFGFLPVGGLVIAINDSPSLPRPVVTVKSSGAVTLTTEQWDLVTGGSGGLVQGAAYYLDNDTLGNLTTVKPTGVGDFVAQVGIATSPTTLRLNTPVVPVQIT